MVVTAAMMMVMMMVVVNKMLFASCEPRPRQVADPMMGSQGLRTRGGPWDRGQWGRGPGTKDSGPGTGGPNRCNDDDQLTKAMMATMTIMLMTMARILLSYYYVLLYTRLSRDHAA